MSWNIKKKGEPSTVLESLKIDPGAPYMPEGLKLLTEELLSAATGTVELNTYGHVYGGLGEAHLIIAAAEPEKENTPAMPV